MRCCRSRVRGTGRRRREPSRRAARRADQPQPGDQLHVRRQARRGVRGRHGRVGAVRGRPAHVLAKLQVPPAPRADVLRRQLPQLHRRRRRGARSARLHRAGPRGHARRARQRVPVARGRRDERDRQGGPFTPPGFYYKTFIRPRRLWPLYEKVLRHAAGLGRLAEEQPEREWRTEYRRRHADVLVIGGGAAGLSAASAAAQLGADVVLVDEGPEPGGRLLVEESREEVRTMVQAARDAGVEIIERGSALGFFDGLVPVWQGDTLHQIRARRHVLATGTIEQPLVFAGNDLPGVMLSDGARRLAAMYAVQPGTRAVVATTSDRGLEAAIALHQRERVGCSRRRPAADPGRAGADARPAWDRGPGRPHDHRGARQEGRQPGRARARRRRGARSGRLTATWSSSRAARSPRARCCCRPARRRATTRRSDTSRSPTRPSTSPPPARSSARSRATRPPTRAGSPGCRPHTRSGSATSTRATPSTRCATPSRAPATSARRWRSRRRRSAPSAASALRACART